MRTMRACEPVTIILLDQQERKFLLTKGALKRIRKEMGVETDAQLFQADEDRMIYAILRHAHQGAELTDDQLDELVPADKVWCGQAIAGIFGASFPDSPTPAETVSESTPAPPSQN